MSKLHCLIIKLFSFRLACLIICVITRNCNNEFILHEKTWPISKYGELEIGLEFERKGFNNHTKFQQRSFKPKKDIQIIQVQGSAVLLLYTNCDMRIVNMIYHGRENHSRYDNRVNHYRDIIV